MPAFDLRHPGFVRLGDLPDLLAIRRFQLRHRQGMTPLNALQFRLMPQLVFLRGAGGLVGNRRRLLAAQIADAPDGVPPFLIDRALGFLKFIFDPLLFQLQMRRGFLDAGIEQPS